MSVWRNPQGQLVNLSTLHWNPEHALFVPYLEQSNDQAPRQTRYYPTEQAPRIQRAIDLTTEHLQLVQAFDDGDQVDLTHANKLELELADIQDGFIFEYGSP